MFLEQNSVKFIHCCINNYYNLIVETVVNLVNIPFRLHFPRKLQTNPLLHCRVHGVIAKKNIHCDFRYSKTQQNQKREKYLYIILVNYLRRFQLYLDYIDIQR